MAIKFNKHNVTDTATKAKARVHYSHCRLTNGRMAVTLYAKDYSDKLADVFPVAAVENNTDIQTDYFEKGRVRIYEGDALYTAAVAACN